MSSIDDLKAFVSTLRLNKRKTDLKKRVWYVDLKHPFSDFTKAVWEPGLDKKLPKGGVIIEGDFGFFMVAALPYRFKDLSTQEIVSVLWPHKADSVFHPDEGDEYWDTIRDQEREVKGFPIEFWVHAPSQSLRLEIYRNYRDAAKGTIYTTASETEYEIMEWKDGERRSVIRAPIIGFKDRLIALAAEENSSAVPSSAVHPAVETSLKGRDGQKAVRTGEDLPLGDNAISTRKLETSTYTSN